MIRPDAMKELILTLKKDNKPRYLQIAAAIRQAIKQGRLQKGESLPSSRTLAKMLKANRLTVMTALDELIAEGWIIGIERKNYQVNQLLPDKFFESQKISKIQTTYPLLNWNQFKKIPDLDHSLQGEAHKIKYRFMARADLRLFPNHQFRLCLNDALKSSMTQLADYGDPAGYPSFIEALKKYLRRVRGITDREILVTHGSQEGIYLTTQLLLNPGDAVAIENLVYQPVLAAIKARGANVIPIHLDHEGMDPDHLAKNLKKKAIKLIYLTPLHQYPTTATLPVARRLRIYELAAYYQIPILEDDYDHEFHYRSQPLPPMASHDPANLIIYVSTLSKTVFPSARLGFMAVPQAIAPQFRWLKSLTTRQNDGIMQDATARWIASGGFESHLRRMRRIYEERLQIMQNILEQMQKKGASLSWQTPAGGMSLWLDTKKNSETIALKAREQGVYVVPEAYFQIKKKIGTHLRMGFANQNAEEILAGLKVLEKVLP